MRRRGAKHRSTSHLAQNKWWQFIFIYFHYMFETLKEKVRYIYSFVLQNVSFMVNMICVYIDKLVILVCSQIYMYEK